MAQPTRRIPNIVVALTHRDISLIDQALTGAIADRLTPGRYIESAERSKEIEDMKKLCCVMRDLDWELFFAETDDEVPSTERRCGYDGA